jgi:hypothetical protein
VGSFIKLFYEMPITQSAFTHASTAKFSSRIIMTYFMKLALQVARFGVRIR